MINEPVVRPRLYRTGDKITITYEVVRDQRNSWDEVKVSIAGREAIKPLSRHPDTLRLGTLEAAPEPPYLPKPGDIFYFVYSDKSVSPSLYRCIAWDGDEGFFHQQVGGPGVRAWHPVARGYDFKKA